MAEIAVGLSEERLVLLGPCEGPSHHAVVVGDLGLQIVNGHEGAPVERFARQDTEPDLDLHGYLSHVVLRRIT